MGTTHESGDALPLSQRLLDALGQAVMATDNAGTVTYWNAAAETLYGWTAAEAVGSQVRTFAVSLDGHDYVRQTVEALARGESWSGELTLRRRDGSQFQAIVTNSGIHDESGELVTLVSVTTHLAEQTAPHTRRRALWQSLLAQSGDVATIADPDTNVIRYVSPAVTGLFGWKPEDLVGRRGRSFVHPEDGERLAAALQTVKASPRAHTTVDFRLLLPDGSYCWVEETISNLIDDPYIRGLVGNLRNISARRAAEDALRVSESRYRLIAETAQEGIWTTDLDGWTVFANQKMADLLGLPLEELYARNSYEFARGMAGGKMATRAGDRLERGVECYEVTFSRRDGGTRMLRISASPLIDDGIHLGTLAMIADVTAARRAENELRFRAMHDALTGLANRAMLVDRLRELLPVEGGAGESPVALLVADIDQFKLVNDSFGHAAGDELLIEVARRWAGLVRAEDMVARLGGDEFVVLCAGASEGEARQLAARLAHSLEEPVELDGRAVTVSASIGIALPPKHDPIEPSILLGHADAAMYEAKAQGRGRIGVFDHRLVARARQRLELFNDLKAALARDELRLAYQPVVELATGRLLGVEALCRWDHPEQGTVSPDVFIPLAEDTGLINALDRWVLRRACQEGAALRAAGVLPPDAFVAVNVSAGHLARTGFEGEVCLALAQAGLPARALVLEVTESAVMRDPDAAQVVLERLRDLGVEVAIDDFGTGYSSLAYLRRFPVHTLKIDRGFVEHLTDNGDDLAIVAAVVDLAKALKVHTTAEGIETFAMLRILKRLGCTAGQGFLWSPALSPAALTGLLAGLPEGCFPIVQPAAGAALPAPRRSSNGLTPSG